MILQFFLNVSEIYTAFNSSEKAHKNAEPLNTLSASFDLDYTNDEITKRLNKVKSYEIFMNMLSDEFEKIEFIKESDILRDIIFLLEFFIVEESIHNKIICFMCESLKLLNSFIISDIFDPFKTKSNFLTHRYYDEIFPKILEELNLQILNDFTFATCSFSSEHSKLVLFIHDFLHSDVRFCDIELFSEDYTRSITRIRNIFTKQTEYHKTKFYNLNTANNNEEVKPVRKLRKRKMPDLNETDKISQIKKRKITFDNLILLDAGSELKTSISDILIATNLGVEFELLNLNNLSFLLEIINEFNIEKLELKIGAFSIENSLKIFNALDKFENSFSLTILQNFSYKY